ncbi:MAG: hypothetical protein V4693_04660 [Pseudomonadota bacterium]
MTISKRKVAAPTTVAAGAAKPARPPARRSSAATATPTTAAPDQSPVPPVAAQRTRKAAPDEKRIRTSFALPERQIALLGELKKRCLGFGLNVKKGELLSAGLQLLRLLPETALEAAILPAMRSGRRPANDKKRKKG